MGDAGELFSSLLGFTFLFCWGVFGLREDIWDVIANGVLLVIAPSEWFLGRSSDVDRVERCVR